MEYQIVMEKEKIVAGIIARTNNFAPDMGSVIGGLWNRLFQEGLYGQLGQLTGTENAYTYGIYTDYDGNEKDDYTAMVACGMKNSAVSAEKLPKGVVIKTLPAGKYAKFCITGDQKTAVSQFWAELWKMKLERTFICDYEEYHTSDCNQVQVDIFIGIR